MEHTLYAPLEYYEKYAKETHDKNTKELFESLRATSGVNIDENRQTVKKYKELPDAGIITEEEFTAKKH